MALPSLPSMIHTVATFLATSQSHLVRPPIQHLAHITHPALSTLNRIIHQYFTILSNRHFKILPSIYADPSLTPVRTIITLVRDTEFDLQKRRSDAQPQLQITNR